MADSVSILARARNRLHELARDSGLLSARVDVQVPDAVEHGPAARGAPPAVVLGEQLIEARLRGARGHAFTTDPRGMSGTLEQVLGLPLEESGDRAIFLATLNAALRHLGRVRGSVYCGGDEPERCACETAELMEVRYGRVEVGLIGFNPAIARRLVETFGPAHVRVQDLEESTAEQERSGAEVSGAERTDELIDASDVVVLTGTTLVNGTFDAIHERLERQGTRYLVYGVTAAGVASLLGFEHICPGARDG